MSSSGGGGSRVEIPSGVRKTLQSIREITGKQHSDEDIYIVLRECSFDPNETAQKLLYLDTFHEVKRKRDRRKETSMPGTQGRGTRNGRGNYSSNHVSSDAGAGRNAASRRENGAHYITQRNFKPHLLAPQKAKISAVPHVAKAPSAVSDGSSNLSNGSSSDGHGHRSSVGGVNHEKKDGSAPLQPAVANQPSSAPTQTFCSVVRVEQEKSTSNYNVLPAHVTPRSVSGVYSSASDPVLAASLSPQPGAVGTIKCEVGSQRKVDEPNHIQANKHVSHDVEFGMARGEKETPGASSMMDRKGASSTSNPFVKNQPSESLQSSSLSTQDGSLPFTSNHDSQSPQGVTTEVPTATVKTNTQLLPESDVADGPHVTFPLHFQVAEALKNGLTFGSFDSSYGIGMKHANGTSGEGNSTCVVECSPGSDETAEAPSPSQSVSSTVQGDNHNNSQSPPPVLEQVPQSDVIVSSGADLKGDHQKQEVLLNRVSYQNPNVQNIPSYSLQFMSPLAGNQLVQFETTETQSWISPASPSSNPNPAVPSSVAASQHPVPLFRQPYPPSYFPYGPYLPPFFMPPMHQFLSPNGLPQQPSTANLYLPPGAAASGVKFPLQQFKQGTSVGNTAHVGIPSGYGSFGSSPVGFNHVPAVTSGSSSSNEDLAASQLKENIYTTGQLSEGPAVWMHVPGQDLSSLQVNSLYNLPLQGHHLTYSPAQAGHGAFSGIYQPAQMMAAPSNPLLQQSQAMTASVETVGPSSAYQQPHLAQINWNTNY